MNEEVDDTIVIWMEVVKGLGEGDIVTPSAGKIDEIVADVVVSVDPAVVGAECQVDERE